MKIIHELTLDVSRQGVQASVPITQHDTGTHVLLMHLRNGSKEIKLNSSLTATLYLSNDSYEAVTVYTENGAHPNTLECNVTPYMSSNVGEITAQLQIFEGADQVFSAPEFMLVVKEDRTSGSKVAQSTPFAAVVAARDEARAASGQAETAKNAAEEFAQAAKVSAQNAAREAIKAAEISSNVANALKGVVTGRTVIMTDVSPIEHKVSVKLSSDAMSDDAEVIIRTYGKNWICYHDFHEFGTGYDDYPESFITNVGDGTIKINGCRSDYQYYMGSVYLPKGTYYLSGAVNNTKLMLVDNESGTWVCEDYGNGAVYESNGGEVGIYLYTWNDAEFNNVIVKPQLEVGEVATEFEPYKGETITTTLADGAELKSISPNMMITVTNTTLVDIDCTYNRDINAAIAGGGGASATFEMWMLDTSNFSLGNYRYRKGMTWREFINSEYNDGRFYEYEGSLVFKYEDIGYSTIYGTNDPIDALIYPNWDTSTSVSLDDVIEYPRYYRSY